MSRTLRRTAQAVTAAIVALGVTGFLVLDRSNAFAASTVTINGSSVLQPIDGFGFSEAFGRTSTITGLSATNQQQVLDLLFNRDTGAGMSILRLGISSTSSSIEPTDPGGPNATPKYVWNGSDDGQVWLAEQAQSYGVSRFYADAWSPPGYMKTNGDEANGGTLCGLSGATCASGDWRAAYANYLVQYARFYAQEGIAITDLGFTNEPNFTATYSSMRLTPAQAVELAKVVGPVATAAGLKLACCDAVNWSSEASYSSAIVADADANRWVTTHTGHSYGNGPTSPLSAGGHHTWMSEWSPDGSTWSTNWDDGSGYDGFTVAQAIQTALTAGNVNGYVYWYGVSTGTTRAFIQANGSTYSASKRLWAMANFSRFIRPGANRIGSTSSDGNLQLSAYRNGDGSVIVVALNTASTNTPVTYSLQSTGVTTGTATPYLTNTANNTAAQPAINVAGGTFSATVPARSLVTYVLRAGGGVTPSATAASPTAGPSISPTSPPTSRSPSSAPPSSAPPSSTPPTGGAGCRVTDTVNAWSTGLTENLTVVNTGGTAINGWSLAFTLPSGQTITSGWNATYSPSSGRVTATNLSYNAGVPPGGSVSFGFQANHTGDSGAPTSFTLNGAACTVT